MSADLDEHGRRIFEPAGDVLDQYLFDRSHVSVIRGPIGSGTSSCSCYKVAAIAAEMPKWRDGVRRSRFAVVRNTYAELRDTTLATWRYWFPEELYGRINLSRPMLHRMSWADVEVEVFFLALDDDGDLKKLRSFEFTGFWFNELEYIIKPIFDEAESRTGRYPPRNEIGEERAWRGIIADMNAPSEEHWVPQMTGEVSYPDETPEDKRYRWPSDWTYHVQPAALIEEKDQENRIIGYRENPLAENRLNLQDGYYLEKIKGKSKDWIDSRLMNRIVTVVDGDPVWPRFSREDHTVLGALAYNLNYPVYVSLDFGRRPTAIIAQEINGRVQIQRELRDYGVGAATFAPALKRFLTQNYAGAVLKFTGDPKGQDRGQADERTAYDIFAAHGMKITPSPVKQNAIETRIEVVAHALDVRQRVLISAQGCPTLVAGMAGKYHFKKLDTGEAEPVKDKYSDPCDCLGYLLIFLGDGRTMIGMTATQRRSPIRRAVKPLNLRRVS